MEQFTNIFSSQWVGIFSTVILVIITAIYAFLTHRIARSNSLMVEQIEKQNFALTRPVIAINILSRQSTVLSLSITNRGNSPAQNLRLEIDKDFYRFAKNTEMENLKNFHVFKNPMPIFAVGDQLIFDLSQGFNFNTVNEGINLTPDTFCITVKYKMAEINFDEIHKIDIRPYFNSLAKMSKDDSLENMEKHLKQISKTLKENNT